MTINLPAKYNNLPTRQADAAPYMNDIYALANQLNSGGLNSFNSLGNVNGLTNPGGATNYALQKGPPTSVVLLGDSITAFNNYVVTLNAGALTAVVGSTTAQIVYASHGLQPQQRCEINSANQVEFNGVWNVASVIDQNTFTVTLSSPATVAIATGTVQIARGNTLGNAGYFTWMTGLKLRLANNAGLGGDTVTNGLVPLAPGIGSRLTKDVFPYNPESIIFCGGINDIANGSLTAAQIFQNALTNIVIPCLALNVPFIWMTLFPTNASWGGNSAANQNTIIAYNALIRKFCASTQNCILADVYAALVDPTSTSGYVQTQYTADGLHPSCAAAQVVGQTILVPIFQSLGVPFIPQVCTPLDSIGAPNSLSTNTTNNPLMQGTGGVAGTGVTGTVPTNYNVTGGGSGTATVSIVARTVATDGDTIGNNLVAACASSATNDTVVIRSSIAFSNQFTNGQWLNGDLSLQWSGGVNLKYITVFVTVTVGGVAYQSTWGNPVIASNGNSYFPTSGKIPVRVPALGIPASGTITGWGIDIQPVFSAASGSVNVTIGRVETPVFATLALAA